MRKKVFLFTIFFSVILLTGCNTNEEVSSIYPSYIKVNGGELWSNYAILYDNSPDGEVKPGTINVLKIEKNTNHYYKIFTIDSSYYKKGDIILGTYEYVYIFNQDEESSLRIVGFNLADDSISPSIVTDEKINSIVKVYGASEKYIYLSYVDNDNTVYMKFSNNLSKSYKLNSVEDIKSIKYNIFN